MSNGYTSTKCACIITMLFFMGVMVYAQNDINLKRDVQAPFDVNEIIEKVSHHPIQEGDRIVIKDKSYEAFFDETGVVLKARESRTDAEDLVIPMNGQPEIRDGKIIYQTPYGEIIFEGNDQGLRFEQITNRNHEYEPQLNFSGNVARLTSEQITEQSREGEFLIDTCVVYVPGFDGQDHPAVAFDGTNYLVVWQNCFSGSYDIYGARVDQAGLVLDSAGIAICAAAVNQNAPAVGFNGRDYLVVWEDPRNGTFDIYGTRVSRAGIILDPLGIAISTESGPQGFPAVTSDGKNYLVVWRDKRTGIFDVYGARVNHAGTVLDPAGIPISTAAYNQCAPAVAFDGKYYFVVWEDGRSGSSGDIYGARLESDGTVLDPYGIAISVDIANQCEPAVVFGRLNYLVTWTDERNGYGDIYGARVCPAGIVLDPNGIVISSDTGSQWLSSVAFDGTNYFVVWIDGLSDARDLYGARVNQDGIVLDPNGFVISNAVDNQQAPAVIFGSTNYLVVWEDYRNCGSLTDIYGARISQAGVVFDPTGIVISMTAYHQLSPSVSFDGANYFVVWEDGRSGSTSDIYGARVGQSGVILDPAGIAISTAEYNQQNPCIDFDGTNYLVAWQDYRNGGFWADIYSARVSQTGNVLDPNGIAVTTTPWNQILPAVAFNGTNYLVVWSDDLYHNIYGARVTQEGSLLDPSGIAITTASGNQVHPCVTTDGANYFVVWRDERNYVSDIYGARVDQYGTVLDPLGIVISNAPDWQSYPAVAFDGTNYLVVWENVYASYYYDIYGARVSQTGTVLDPSGIAVCTAVGKQTTPSIIFDGANYFVVWQDCRNGTSSDIYGVQINPAGVIINSFPISRQPGNQLSPSLAHGLGTQILITYSGWTDHINGQPTNTMRIWGMFY